MIARQVSRELTMPLLDEVSLDPYFERGGQRMPPEAGLVPGDIVVTPRTLHEIATDAGRYAAIMDMWVAAVRIGCEVIDLDDGPNGELRRLIRPARNWKDNTTDDQNRSTS